MKKVTGRKKVVITWKSVFFVLNYLTFFNGTVFSQDKPADQSILDHYNQYRSRYLQDKLFAHTDKNSYVSREIIWFRLYYRDAFFNREGTISQIAYVEILDRNNQPLLQEKVSLKPGESNGSMIIPVSIPTGMYTFRAYTNWMKNLGPEYFFEKAIQIVNPQNLQRDSGPAGKNRYDIQFFPEGGNLVQNVENKMAFRVTNAYGKGLDFEGAILGSAGDTVLKFHPRNMGLGNFLFTPKAGQNYHAMFRFSNGDEINQDLPASYAQGIVMRVSKTSGGQIQVQVKTSLGTSIPEMYLFVHGNQTSLPVKKETVTDHQAVFTIEPGALENGISQFTIFDHEARPVCERLYFKYPQHPWQITAETGTEYATRKKIDLNLSSTDPSGRPLAADLSMAVYRLDSLQRPDDCDIRYYFYLTGELGPVESPGYYFQNNGRDREEDMDNLMLTQGWRRYDWKNLMNNSATAMAFPPEMHGHIIRGKIISKTGSPVPNAEAYLSVPSARTEFRTTVSNESGDLKFEIPDFYGSQELIVQTSPREDSTNHIEISNPFFQKYSARTIPDISFPASGSTDLLALAIHEQVQHVYTGAKLNRFTLQQVDTNPFYVVPEEKYYLDDYTRFLTMEEVIREYVRGSNVTRRKDKFQVYLFDNPHRGFFNSEPLILIDGVPFFDGDELFRQDPKKIRRLDLVNREYALGDRSFSGLINLTTYKGDLDGIQMNPRAIVLDYPGIQEQREFFSPVYETENQITSRLPDYRTLLYWAPQIKTGATGKNQAGFYSSDLPGKYVVVIQGLSENGEPGSQVVFFTVKK